MESAAMNFAYRFIKDGKARASYISQTNKMAQDFEFELLQVQSHQSKEQSKFR
jgi:hypothetical protein